jgi:MYXO-CTERM domain-containing protein
MKTGITRSLFGGALLAAGLTAGAQAQFSIGSSYSRVWTTEYAYFTSDNDAFIGSGPMSIQGSVANDYASAYAAVVADAMQIRTAASVNNGSAYSPISYMWFGVGQDSTVSLDWDFTQAYGFVRIDDITNGGVLFGVFDSSSGSVQLPLLADNAYVIRGFSAARSEGKAGTWWTLTVPSPGATGMLGLAGIFACRRRRPMTRDCPSHP